MPAPVRLSLYLAVALVVSLTGISACDLLTEAEDGDACWITWAGSDIVFDCFKSDSAQECEQRAEEISDAMQSRLEGTYDVGGGACSTPPGDGDGSVPGGCDAGDYSSNYGPGDEQMDYMCQTAWKYRCEGYEQEADATCQSIQDYAGSNSDCPYC